MIQVVRRVRACAGRRIADGDAEAACCTSYSRQVRFGAGACSLVKPMTGVQFINYRHARYQCIARPVTVTVSGRQS